MTIVEMIEQAAAKYGVPADLAISVARRESSLNPAAVNPTSGAVGLFQLLPSTASMLGVDPYDVNGNIDGGVRYLAQLYNRYGSWDRALTVYGGFVRKSPVDYLRSILAPVGLWPAGGSTASPETAGGPADTNEGDTWDHLEESAGGSSNVAIYILLGTVVVAGILWSRSR